MVSTIEFTHLLLGEMVESISGHYVPEREMLIKVGDREVVYIVGHAVIDTSCCGPGGGNYALVPGYIVKWKYRTNSDGLAVSLVEPVTDEAGKNIIKKIILENGYVSQINFW